MCKHEPQNTEHQYKQKTCSVSGPTYKMCRKNIYPQSFGENEERVDATVLGTPGFGTDLVTINGMSNCWKKVLIFNNKVIRFSGDHVV